MCAYIHRSTSRILLDHENYKPESAYWELGGRYESVNFSFSLLQSCPISPHFYIRLHFLKTKNPHENSP